MNRAQREPADAWKRGYVDEATGQFVLPASGPQRPPPRRRARVRAVPEPKPVVDTFGAYVDAQQAAAMARASRYSTRAARCAVWGVLVFIASHYVGGAALWAISVALGGLALWFWDRAKAETRVSRIGSL